MTTPLKRHRVPHDAFVFQCEDCGADICMVQSGDGYTVAVDCPVGTPHAATCSHRRGADPGGASQSSSKKSEQET